MKRFYLLTAALFLFSIVFFSCTESSVENKIDGTWQMLNMGNLNADDHVEWTLLNGYIYMQHTYVGSSTIDTIANGVYNIKIKRFSRYLCLSEFPAPTSASPQEWNGDYKITKLNSKYLVLVKDQDLLEMYEFVKK